MLMNSFFDETMWKKLKVFSSKFDTPFLLMNLDGIKEKYLELSNSFSKSKIYYAVKANPADEIIMLLKDLGSSFDVASIYELDKVLKLGVDPSKISFGNTIKKSKDIKYSYEKGVRLFASDCEDDIKNISVNAPGSSIYVRILTEGSRTADWPLSRKFGCEHEMAIDLLILAKELKLNPIGISFHVGSQQREIATWGAAITKVKHIIDTVKAQGIKLELLNMGGGFPANYLTKTHDFSNYAENINRYLIDNFDDDIPDIILEPGRSLVGEAGILVSEVVMISKKSRDAMNKWVYLDVGVFGGLIETLDEAIKYPLFTDYDMNDEADREEVILAGPTCDSMDILYEDFKYQLPIELKTGDRVYWISAGAYTSSYSSVEFNGFPPLKTIFYK